ncbi:hypothetical protein SNEBB_009878 [Seison nebaliae]|nr:hypothetical protein SNEBB_009878 [Seison nebaliae]
MGDNNKITQSKNNPMSRKIFSCTDRVTKTTSWPIVYSEKYNIKSKVHNSSRYLCNDRARKILNAFLELDSIPHRSCLIEPCKVEKKELLECHSAKYIRMNKFFSCSYSKIFEKTYFACIPVLFHKRTVLRSHLYQIGGSLLAAKLAIERGWAINLGGGFTEAEYRRGSCGCIYSDILLITKMLRQDYCIQKILILDLDARQGVGYQRTLINDTNIIIVDICNPMQYPRDLEIAEKLTHYLVVKNGCRDDPYLSQLTRILTLILRKNQIDFVIYIAGMNLLINDSGSLINLTFQGMMEKDKIVFRSVRKRDIPILMLLPNGENPDAIAAIAQSIKQLIEANVIGVSFDCQGKSIVAKKHFLF